MNAAFARDERGAVAVLTALALPVLLGSAALACEAGWWLVETRSLQNAADAAAVAASFAGTAFDGEARAVAAAHGFGNVAVNAAGNRIRVTVATPTIAVLGELAPRLSASATASVAQRRLIE